MKQQEFQLIGHKCPMERYPSTVIPILQDIENKLYAVYLVSFGIKATLISINNDLHFAHYNDELIQSFSFFDQNKDRLFAFSESKVVLYKIQEEQEFFIGVLNNDNFSNDNPFLRLSLAEITNNPIQIKKELVSCGQKLQEETPEFFDNWCQEQEKQLKEDFPAIWREILPIEINRVQNITILERNISNQSSELESVGQISMTSNSDNCQFETYLQGNLEPYHLVPQSLDNQWIPRSLLYKMIREKLSFNDIQSQVEQDKRMEFRRALINSRQLVINRAAIYNETTVSECYEQTGENREAFKVFLNDGTIIPFLFSEDSPIKPPAFTTSAFEAWKEVCQEVNMKCVRLSWDDDNQSEIRKHLSREFHEFCKSTTSGDIDSYIGALDLPEDAREPFKNRLRDLRNKCIQIEDEDELITREQLYEAFVTADRTKPVDRKYDFTKPFAAEIKQLIDLKYNVNLPDALGGIALTPYDSIPRSALQEKDKFQRDKSSEKNTEYWLKLLRDSTFERLQQGFYLESLLEEGYLDSLASLNLQEVLEVRGTDEWNIYMQNMDNLLNNPEQFEAMAEPVFDSYLKLIERMTNLVKSKRSEKVEIWTPAIEYILDISGAQLTVNWSDEGVKYAFSGEVPSSVSKRKVRYFEKLRIAGSQDKQADLNMTIELNKGTTNYPGEQWEALKRQIQEIPGFSPVRPELILLGNDATINRSEEVDT